MKDKVIMYDSQEAASIQSVTGWVCRDGYYWGQNEHQARYSGSTHVKCKSNPEHEAYSKNSYCKSCDEEKRQARFDAMEIVEWDQETPLNLYDTEQYFFSSECVEDYCDHNKVQKKDLKLVLCKPNNMHHVDEDQWVDCFADDFGLPDEVQTALDNLNQAIEDHGKAVSWSPSNKRVILE